MPHRRRLARLPLLAALAFLAPLSAHAAVPLGAAASFAVLGGSTVTSAGISTIVGDLGVSPGFAITGFGPGTVTGGSIHINDGPASAAHADAATAYTYLAGLPATQTLTGTDLGGLTLTPGVYFFASSAFLTGTLTLDAGGDPDPLFVFQIGSTLTTAPASAVALINGATADDVFFQVGSSATLDVGTAFAGTIIALASDTLNTGATLDGRAIALNAAVTLDGNTITRPASNVQVPEPAAAALAAPALLALTRRPRRSTLTPRAA